MFFFCCCKTIGFSAIENGIVNKMANGGELTVDYLEKHGFNKPILIENKKELEFIMPDSSEINLTKIENIVGE